jgi:hypothetical protein
MKGRVPHACRCHQQTDLLLRSYRVHALALTQHRSAAIGQRPAVSGQQAEALGACLMPPGAPRAARAAATESALPPRRSHLRLPAARMRSSHAPPPLAGRRKRSAPPPHTTLPPPCPLPPPSPSPTPAPPPSHDRLRLRPPPPPVPRRATATAPTPHTTPGARLHLEEAWQACLTATRLTTTAPVHNFNLTT